MRALKKVDLYLFSALEAMCGATAFFEKPAMSGFLIAGAQHAEPLLLNRGTEKGWFVPFSVASLFIPQDAPFHYEKKRFCNNFYERSFSIKEENSIFFAKN
jgi:hypothetical protein